MIQLKYHRVLFGLLAAVFFISYLHSQEPSVKSKETETIEGKKYYKHKVQKGETLYAIAKTYSLEAKDILIENPGAMDGIKPGQILRIPFNRPKSKPEIPVKTSPSDTSKYISHKVETGQTLFSISKQYKVPMDVITAANPQLKEGLKAGQVIRIPRKQKAVPDQLGIPLEKASEPLPFDSVSLALAVALEKKMEYNIALMLPFGISMAEDINSDEIRNGNAKFPARSALAVEFYQGALLAADSLKRTGFKCRMFVYDTQEGDSILKQVLKKPEMKEMDLIVGPLTASNFSGAALFARENKIPVVAPYLQHNKIIFENPYVSKITSSVNTQMEQMAVFVADSFRKEKLFMVSSGNAKETGVVKGFKTHLNDRLQKGGSASDTVTEVRSFSQLESLLKVDKVNVVSIVSMSQPMVMEYLGKLYRLKDKFRIVVTGMQGWSTFENLDFEYLNALQLHLPVVSFIDYENSGTKQFIRKYRQSYGTDPDATVFLGYDILFYYLNALREKGTGFIHVLPSLPSNGIHTGFSLYRPSAGSGYENRSVYIIKYSDYKQVKAN